jgi:DegV family protein with EDD domain
MLRIVTDGASDMPPGWETEYKIDVLPLRVSFGEDTYTQGDNFSLEDFYRLVRETRIIPKTSLPSPGQVMEFYRRIATRGDTILSMHITSKLSGTFSTIQSAAQELKDEFRILTFDSGAGSAAVGYMCREARLMDRAGLSPEQIIRRMERIREKLILIFTLDNLEFAYLNGRINAFQNVLSSLLNVKPIVILREGLLEIAGKVRTRQKAFDHILNAVQARIGSHPAYVAVVHAADPAAAHALAERIRTMINVKESIITDLAIPVAANLGPGTIGIVAFPADEE